MWDVATAARTQEGGEFEEKKGGAVLEQAPWRGEAQPARQRQPQQPMMGKQQGRMLARARNVNPDQPMKRRARAAFSVTATVRYDTPSCTVDGKLHLVRHSPMIERRR